MATSLTVDELREALHTPQAISTRPFDVLKSISLLLNATDTHALGREMVLRALEHRPAFGSVSPLLDSFARATGLFPYADPDALELRDRLAYEFHRPMNMPDEFVFHREQAEVYRRLLEGTSVILSAPTSFGKSRIIDAMIATGRFTNIAIIVPTLALIDETRRRLSAFSQSYKIITHLSQKPGDRNLFVFTGERAVGYEHLPRIDFFVIDEFYKIGAMEEDEVRTVALNQAFYRLRKGGGQFYLLGPNVQEIPTGLQEAFQCFFYPTSYSTVAIEQERVRGKGSKLDRLIALAKTLDEPTMIFCSSPQKVNAVARELINAGIGIDSSELQSAADWGAQNYHADWTFCQAIVKGVGIHHARLPRAIGQYVVRKFNEERLQFLVCTSTLIEGVNTKAKNVVIWDHKIAKQPIDYFTFNNIRGRSGRMFEHFVGRVYLFEDPPTEKLPFVDFPVFTQDGATPISLLMQMENADLSEASKERMKGIAVNSDLPLDVMRENKSVEPERQVNLARAIAANATALSPLLTWTYPKSYEQLKTVCELIWNHLVDAKRWHGVLSGSQLTQRTWQAMYTKSAVTRVQNELNVTPQQYAARNADEAIDRVLQFERTWLGFELPRYLMTASRIQRVVLGKLGLSFGDYSAFAAQSESYFRAPVVAALDEYGIPLQVAEKIQPLLGSADDFDVAMTNLKALRPNSLNLSDFEREVITDAQSAF